MSDWVSYVMESGHIYTIPTKQSHLSNGHHIFVQHKFTNFQEKFLAKKNRENGVGVYLSFDLFGKSGYFAKSFIPFWDKKMK